MSEQLTQKRKDIRHAVVNILKGQTKAGDRVYTNRVRSLFADSEPSILVYTRSEITTPREMGNKTLRRSLQLAIELRAEAKDGLDDLFDDLSDEVEQLLRAQYTLQDTCQNTLLTNVEFDESAAGDKIIGAARLTYDVIYFN